MLNGSSTRSGWGEPDGALGTCVAQIDRLTEPVHPGFPLSLTVHGLLVSGELIPQWQWFAEVSESTDNEDAFYTGMAEHMREQSDLAHDAIKLHDTGGEVTHRQYVALMAPTRYIHLRNTRIHAPEQTVGKSCLWRGRLCDVSGWSPGEPS
jgi:hypothetical protein